MNWTPDTFFVKKQEQRQEPARVLLTRHANGFSIEFQSAYGGSKAEDTVVFNDAVAALTALAERYGVKMVAVPDGFRRVVQERDELREENRTLKQPREFGFRARLAELMGLSAWQSETVLLAAVAVTKRRVADLQCTVEQMEKDAMKDGKHRLFYRRLYDEVRQFAARCHNTPVVPIPVATAWVPTDGFGGGGYFKEYKTTGPFTSVYHETSSFYRQWYPRRFEFPVEEPTGE